MAKLRNKGKPDLPKKEEEEDNSTRITSQGSIKLHSAKPYLANIYTSNWLHKQSYYQMGQGFCRVRLEPQ